MSPVTRSKTRSAAAEFTDKLHNYVSSLRDTTGHHIVYIITLQFLETCSIVALHVNVLWFGCRIDLETNWFKNCYLSMMLKFPIAGPFVPEIKEVKSDIGHRCSEMILK